MNRNRAKNQFEETFGRMFRGDPLTKGRSKNSEREIAEERKLMLPKRKPKELEHYSTIRLGDDEFVSDLPDTLNVKFLDFIVGHNSVVSGSYNELSEVYDFFNKYIENFSKFASELERFREHTYRRTVDLKCNSTNAYGYSKPVLMRVNKRPATKKRPGYYAFELRYKVK